MMRSREGKVPPATDLLVCFPTRAHLRLMPKPICSPARPSLESVPYRHRRKSSSTTRIGSPLLWAKSKAAHNPDVSEPTSPKVTCAGQIKVRAKVKPPAAACKNWQSVMEEIERIHNHKRKHKKRPSAAYSWIESLGFQKDVTQFLRCLRNLRFNFRCFGAFPSAGNGITSDDDDDEEKEEDDDNDEIEQENRRSKEESDCNSNAVFSKWYMILQENQGAEEFANPEEVSKGKTMMAPCLFDDEHESGGAAQTAPPPNALLLMRCRSAPAKNWPPPEEKQETAAAEFGEDMWKISEEIAKETWIVGGIREMLARSRSCKR